MLGEAPFSAALHLVPRTYSEAGGKGRAGGQPVKSGQEEIRVNKRIREVIKEVNWRQEKSRFDVLFVELDYRLGGGGPAFTDQFLLSFCISSAKPNIIV